jgi:hypothetical protein
MPVPEMLVSLERGISLEEEEGERAVSERMMDKSYSITFPQVHLHYETQETQ